MKTDEALILEAEERLFAAIMMKDALALEAELTEDFVHSPIGGAVSERKAFLEGVRTMPYRIHGLEGRDQRARVFGDMALLEGIQVARVELEDGKTVEDRTAFVDLFVRSGDSWKLRHAVELPEATVEGQDGA